MPIPKLPELPEMPSRKVTTGVALGAVGTILVWILQNFIEVPVAVAMSMQALIVFGFQYMVKDNHDLS